jgi:hypothetical protein
MALVYSLLDSVGAANQTSPYHLNSDFAIVSPASCFPTSPIFFIPTYMQTQETERVVQLTNDIENAEVSVDTSYGE